MKSISNMTASEAADELTLMEVSKVLSKTRNAIRKAEEYRKAAYQAIEDMCIDIDAPIVGVPGVSTVGQAISVYLDHDGCRLGKILQELRVLYTEQSEL